MDLSFSGCGFLGIYHIGVASCFKEHAPNVIRNVSGASAGVLVGCCLVAGVDFGKITDNVLRLVQKARARLLGPFHPFFDLHGYINEGLHKVLPENIHELASGRLFVSLTRVWDKTNTIVSEFKSKEEVIQAVLCSAFVPFYSGMVPPTFRGTKYWDGGITDNCPILSEDTVTVCPFSGEFDICPTSQEFGDYLRFTSANVNVHVTSTNFWRLSRALYPPEPEKLRKLCQQGYDDTLRYLQSHTVIPCNRHLSLSRSPSFSSTNNDNRKLSTGRLSLRNALLSRTSLQSLSSDLELLQEMLEGADSNETWEDWNDEDFFEDEDACQDCKMRAEQTMLKGSLSPQITNAIKEAIMLDNTLLNYLFKYKMLKAVSFMALPYVITMETVLLFTVRFARRLPHVPNDVHYVLQRLIHLIKVLLRQYHTTGRSGSDTTRSLNGKSSELLTAIRDDDLTMDQLEDNMNRIALMHSQCSHHSHAVKPLPDCVMDTFDLCDDVFVDQYPRTTSRLHHKYCNTKYESYDQTILIVSEIDDVTAYHYLRASLLIDTMSTNNNVEIKIG
ncbi:1-acylglycerol-3-phosphate O-acyltransferase Pnpla3-like [Asterias rubens]|uniref:1-acylglycerol-3-phosphate O-acyltransferase Pnpla3-like n=1 Tax=Asterias rubens TaxID=7604 RepID=UPI001455B464|nr:1-acylglycerol-3-phosphate O-acyltransferase Pnpla3-like [Asterias rubens]